MSFVVVVEEILKRFKNMEINQGGVGCKSQVASRKCGTRGGVRLLPVNGFKPG